MQKTIFLWIAVAINAMLALDAMIRSIWKLMKFGDFSVHISNYLLIISLCLALITIYISKAKQNSIFFMLPFIVLSLCKG